MGFDVIMYDTILCKGAKNPMMKRVLSVAIAAVLLVGLFCAFPVAATATSGMTVSEDCADTIKRMEGFYAIPYWDYSQWTVGYGTTCPSDKLSLYQKEGIPMDEADALLEEQLNKFAEGVNDFLDRTGLTFNQGQFDALTSMTYNLGSAMLYNENNRVYRAIMDGKTGNDLIFAFSVYCTAGGEFLPGLMRRRLVEANMYINGEYDDYAPENYCYVLFDANGGVRDVMAQGYDCNMEARPMSMPTYAGYTFAGWYTQPTGGVKISHLDESTDGMTLYAHWEKGQSQADNSTLPGGKLEVTVTEDAVNVRNGAGISFAIMGGLFRGEKITITGLATVEGQRWGQFEQGWIPLDYTNYAELTGDHGDSDGDSDDEQEITVPVRATVLSSSGVTLYNGPHTTYPKLGTLAEGTEIEITEVYTVFDTQWGKCSQGWVQLNLRLQLHDEQRLAHSFVATVDYLYLNVRSGPGTEYSRTSSLQQGEKVTIVSIVYVDSTPWGRFEKGWISLDYTDFDTTLFEQYSKHSFGSWTVSKQPTCVSVGEERRVCQYCEEYESRELPCVGHTYGEWYVAKEGTCVTPGLQQRDCAHCDAYETRETELTDHSYGDWYIAKEGNCTTPAQERRDCRFCDAFETRESVAGGHSFGQWEQVVAPSCSAPGVQQRKCVYCGELELEEIAQTEHNYDAWVEYLSATCVTEGEQRRYCLDCGGYESQTLPLADHSFGQWYETVAPSADAPGEERRDCANCDEYETRVVDPTEHVYEAWFVVTEATCTEPGEERRNCQHCEMFETRVIPATGHSMGAWYVTEAPACDKEGWERSDCANCDHFATAVIAATGHEFGEWLILKEGDCLTDGQRGRICMVCTYLQTETVPANGHKYSDWVTVSEPTCTDEGERVCGCSVCGETIREKLPATGHNYGDWYTVTEAVCGQEGQDRRDCATCGAFETRTVMASDHSFGQWYIYREAVCGVDGEVRRDCSKCGYCESRVLEAPDHSFGDWETVKQASCGVEGQEARKCNHCGATESRAIPALSHSYGDWYVAVEPTATSDGEERRDCANCGKYESRKIDRLAQTVTKTYGTVTDYYYVNVRAGTGTGYALVGRLFFGDRVEILETKTVGGALWGRIGEGQWVSITGYITLETVEEVESVTRTYATITCDVLNIRVDAGSGNSAVGYLINGDVVEVLEQKTVSGSVWGRIDKGWICLTGYATLHTETEGGATEVEITVMGTLTSNTLNIRSGAGTGYTKVGSLTKGDYVQVYELTLVGSNVWGRIDKGWICITGYMELEIIRKDEQPPAPPVHTHSYGEWYVVQQAVCGTPGQERRDCSGCDEYETREISAPEHSYSEWKVLKPATCTATGTRQRVCSICGDAQNEVLPANGHSFGDWYEVKAATFDEEGQEKRDCSVCGASETRVIEKLTNQVPYRTFGIVTADSINVRSGPSTSYTRLGSVKKGDEVEIYELARDSYYWLWGRTDIGWIRVDGYVDMRVEATGADQPNAKVYATVTVNAVNVRSGPGASYTFLGTLYKGMKVEVLDQKCLSNGSIWIKIGENSWTCFTEYMTMEAEIVENQPEPTIMVVNISSMNIRDAAGYDSNVLGVLNKGVVVKVYEVITVGSTKWAYTDFGWLKYSCLI